MSPPALFAAKTYRFEKWLTKWFTFYFFLLFIIAMTAEAALELNYIFAALSDDVRRDILLRLSKAQQSVSELAEQYKMSLVGVRKHIKSLERAKLVQVVKVGRTQYCRIEPSQFELAKSHLEFYEQFWSEKITNFEKLLMEKKRSEKV